MLYKFRFAFLFLMSALEVPLCVAQSTSSNKSLSLLNSAAYTPVKNQANTGTCWSYSVTSLVESQALKVGLGNFDLSEMFTVRNIYIEKAKNYVLRQGAAQFGSGGLGHDVVHSIVTYGAIPENVYSGLLLGRSEHNHDKMDRQLKQYLDSLLSKRPIPYNWQAGFQRILDNHLGKPPETFLYHEKRYTPKTFASEILHFNPDDYIAITSFSHHAFYAPFVLEVPDNFQNGSYYNLPLAEVISITERALQLGYSLMWDADVTNTYFRQHEGFAMMWKDTDNLRKPVNPDAPEMPYDQDHRQMLFENLTTQDDHLMHMVGIEKSPGGKRFFLVKNSWGDVGPYHGLIHVSESYFAINTISLIVPRAVLTQPLLAKLRLTE